MSFGLKQSNIYDFVGRIYVIHNCIKGKIFDLKKPFPDIMDFQFR